MSEVLWISIITLSLLIAFASLIENYLHYLEAKKRKAMKPPYYLCGCGNKYENAQDAAHCCDNFLLIIDEKEKM